MQQPAHDWVWADKLLSRPDRPTAIIGGWHAATQMAMARGLRVPQDLSLIEWARPAVITRMFNPAMAALDTDIEVVMQMAFEMLERLLAGETPEASSIRIKSQLFLAESTGPVPVT
jgi:DNA-binding LacI/PurR family transcriptional regulator